MREREGERGRWGEREREGGRDRAPSPPSSKAARRRRQAPASQPIRAGQLQEADCDFTPSKLSRPGRSKVHVVHSFGHGTVLHAVLHSVIFDSVKTSI